MKTKIQNLKPAWFLLTGMMLMTASHLTFNVDILGWVAMVPFLIYLNLTKGWKSRALFSIILFFSWSLVIFKIITDPIPLFIIPLYAVPITLFHLPGYLIYGLRIRSRWSIFIFPGTMVVLEWIQYSFTPFGSWGVAAYTQSNSISMLQSLSWFGMAGLSFLLYWANAAITEAVLKGNWKQHVALPALAIFTVLIIGSLRYDRAHSKARETITVAAVGTDSEISGLPLPPRDSNEKILQDIFTRTSIAAEAGAKMVVWNEAAFFLEQDYEQDWIDSISKLANRCKVFIVAAYVVPISTSPFQFENKFKFFKPDGTIAYEYFKHEPVPGEPAVKGKGPMQIQQIDKANIGGAICYDYDFPYLARRNKNAGADIVALPSSDWRGIDPLHSKMAAFRAIEQGHSILRSTRFGLSAAITPYGDMTSRMSSFDHNDKIMMAHLPVKGIRTFYSIAGDFIVYLSMAFLLLIMIRSTPIK